MTIAQENRDYCSWFYGPFWHAISLIRYTWVVAAKVPDARVRLAAAMKLYELDELSSEEAAELAGVPLVEFLRRRGEFGVLAFTQTTEELKSEYDVAWAASSASRSPAR